MGMNKRTWERKRRKALTNYIQQWQNFWIKFHYILELKRRVKILS